MPSEQPQQQDGIARILLIDGDMSMADRQRNAFAGNEILFEQTQTRAQAMSRLRSGEVDLITLDLDLPQANGLDLLRVIRAETGIPVIIVTARAPRISSVLCLELGADDFVLKPIDPDELNARIRAILRRRAGNAQMQGSGFGEAGIAGLTDGTVEFAGWRFDMAGLSLWSDRGTSVDVTATEAKVLRYLVRNAKQPVSRGDLNRHIHGSDRSYDDRSVDVLVKKLRAKIATHSPNLEAVKSVRGVGYMFSPDVRPAGESGDRRR